MQKLFFHCVDLLLTNTGATSISDLFSAFGCLPDGSFPLKARPTNVPSVGYFKLC